MCRLATPPAAIAGVVSPIENDIMNNNKRTMLIVRFILCVLIFIRINIYPRRKNHNPLRILSHFVQNINSFY